MNNELQEFIIRIAKRTRIISLVLILFIPAACRHATMTQNTAGSVRVRVDSLIKGSVSLPIHSNGTLLATEELKLSFKTGGIVSGIFVREGIR